MTSITLENQNLQGEPLKATFLPEQGMNMISFTMGNVEVIAQSTRSLFEERYAGLGALIGPHFHRRPSNILPLIKDENRFPHIARTKAKGIQDPFSHGIARYAPWKVESSKTKLKGELSGKDQWNGVPLAELEGQNFKMNFEAELKQNGLFLQLDIVSDTDSLVGIHYYYSLPKNQGVVKSQVKDHYIEKNEKKSFPKNWKMDQQHWLTFDLAEEADFTFHPYPNPLEGKIILQTEVYSLQTIYTSHCQENCWQLYHPAGSDFVCIEPLSSQDPKHPNLSVSSLNIHLEISEPGVKNESR